MSLEVYNTPEGLIIFENIKDKTMTRLAAFKTESEVAAFVKGFDSGHNRAMINLKVK